MPDLVTLSACPACSGGKLTSMISGVEPNLEQVPDRYDFDRCMTCGMAFTNPRVPPDRLAALYALLPGGQHYEAGDTPVLPSRFSWSNISDPSFRNLISALPMGHILDIGCGQGALLKLIVDSGRTGAGVDFSESAQAAGRDRGLDIRQVDLNTFIPEADAYDGMVLRHVLEHIEDPLGLLTRLRGGLRAGGRIVIEVPNLNSVTRHLFGAAWNGWDAPFHVNQFTPGALARLLKKSGYGGVETRTIGVVDEVRRSFGRLRKREGRYDVLRVAALPLYKTVGFFGGGSTLQAIGNVSGA